MGTPKPISVMLLVRSLEAGGAERQLVELARGLKSRGHSVWVGVFYKRGPLLVELEVAGVPVVDLEKGGRWDIAGFALRTCRQLRKIRPDVLYCFLADANIAGAIAAGLAPKTKLVWSVRSSNVDLRKYEWFHTAVYRIERAISSCPRLIIANSNAGKLHAIQRGLPASKIEVVVNGVDETRFRFDPRLRAAQRRVWGLAEDHIAIGVLARLDPMKDQQTFLRAASLAGGSHPRLRFLCIGEGPDEPSLRAFARALGITEDVIFPGRADPVAALSALDIACSSSITEGFPNAVAEAMAMGLPCVVTDVGDSASLVGNCGTVVRASDPEALATALLEQVERLRVHNRDEPRKRVEREFSAEAMVARTVHVLTSLA